MQPGLDSVFFQSVKYVLYFLTVCKEGIKWSKFWKTDGAFS